MKKKFKENVLSARHKGIFIKKMDCVKNVLMLVKIVYTVIKKISLLGLFAINVSS